MHMNAFVHAHKHTKNSHARREREKERERACERERERERPAHWQQQPRAQHAQKQQRVPARAPLTAGLPVAHTKPHKFVSEICFTNLFQKFCFSVLPVADTNKTHTKVYT